METNPEKCIVLVPVFSLASLEDETKTGLQELERRGYRVRLLIGSSQIDLARSTMATRAMREGYAETMWIDGDVTFDPDDVDRLRAAGQPMVAGLYPKKGRKEFAGAFLDGMTGATFGKDGGLLEMKFVGMGFTLIRAEVFEAIGRSMTLCKGGYEGEDVMPYFLPVADGVYGSEDAAFCVRARQAGFTVFADTRVKLGHLGGKRKWTWEDLLPDKPEVDALYLGSHQPKSASDPRFVATDQPLTWRTIPVGISRKTLEEQRDGIIAQIERHKKDIVACEGALQVTAAFIAKLDEQEAIAEAEAENARIAAEQGKIESNGVHEVAEASAS